MSDLEGDRDDCSFHCLSKRRVVAEDMIRCGYKYKCAGEAYLSNGHGLPSEPWHFLLNRKVSVEYDSGRYITNIVVVVGELSILQFTVYMQMGGALSAGELQPILEMISAINWYTTTAPHPNHVPTLLVQLIDGGSAAYVAFYFAAFQTVVPANVDC